MVDGVDCVYGVSIRVNVNDGNDVGTDRAICPCDTTDPAALRCAFRAVTVSLLSNTLMSSLIA